MTRAYVEAPATHFRLKPETWAIIAEEYKNGASAKDIGAKWKVAPSSVYRHACSDGWTKKSMGDARARAHARMVEEEEAASQSLNPIGSRALKSLFAPAPADDPEMTDPAALAKQATLASGRAMRGRLWTEAKALAGLAESYRRLAAAEAAARNAATQAEAQSWWPKTMEEEEEMREALYGQLMRRAQAIDEEEAFEAAQGMAEAMGVEGPDLEDLWREIEASDAELATGGGGAAKAGV